MSPGSLICFADDGSRTKDAYARAAAYLAGRDVSRFYPLGSPTTVFQAEVYVVMEIAKMYEVKRRIEEIVYLFSDSQAALRSLNSIRNECPLVQECRDALANLSGNKKLVSIYTSSRTYRSTWQ